MSPVAVATTVAVVVLALTGMLLSWRGRARGQRGLRLPADAAGAQGPALAAASGTHHATTFAGRPLERVVAGGLGFRAGAALTVLDAGLRVERDGAAPFTVPADRISGAGTGTWALDRGVEPGGLLVVAWSLDGPDGPVPVESAFRLGETGQSDVLAALRALVPAAADTPDRPLPEVPRADRPS